MCVRLFASLFYQPLLYKVICLDSIPLAGHNGYPDLSVVSYTHTKRASAALVSPLILLLLLHRGNAIQKCIIRELAASSPGLLSSSPQALNYWLCHMFSASICL